MRENLINTIKVLFIASEADPFIKVGGLGDVAGSLPLAIHHLKDQLPGTHKIDIRLVIPYYTSIKKQPLQVRKVTSFFVDTLTEPILSEVFTTNVSGMTVYFISGEPIDRDQAVYGKDFRSDAEKFIFFSLACLQLPRVLNWNVDILHANDWHTAVAVHMLHTKNVSFPVASGIRSIITLHNLPFMGAGAEEALKKYKILPSKNKYLPLWGKSLPLPMGLAAADKIIPVSPSYANEILTPEYGCDLHTFLETRKKHISGILNGIDLEYWNPATDNQIEENYDSSRLELRKRNKTALQKEFGLEKNPDIPLLILISRMDQQKGVDIALAGLRKIQNLSWQAILLGTGDPKLEASCRKLQADLPNKVRAVIGFDAKLSRRMYAGGDILMMPSRYEPCGLAQMIAMRYGCIPVARATGGLVDSIIDARNDVTGTGFLFTAADTTEFKRTLILAMRIYHNKDQWKQIQLNALSQEFSWTRSAEKYLAIYESL